MVALLIRRLPDKSLAPDPIPTSVLTGAADLLAPYIANLFNISTAVGRFQSLRASVYHANSQASTGLDTEDVKSQSPTSNLPVLSKLLKRLPARRLIYYIFDVNLQPLFHSGFRTLHSTETAVLGVLPTFSTRLIVATS
jgi:hypothetical protein